MRVSSLAPWIAVSALALTACGGGGGDAPPDATTGAVPSASTTTSGSTTTDAASPATQEISGTGYRTSVPASWRDQSQVYAGSAIKIDRLYASTSGATKGQNLVVIRENPAAIRGKRIDELEEQLRTQAAQAVGAPLPPSDPASKLDGEDARGWTLRSGEGSAAKVQRQLAVVHDDAIYSLTVSTSRSRDDGEALLRTIVDGWRWEADAGG